MLLKLSGWIKTRNLVTDFDRKQFILDILLLGVILLSIIAFVAKLYWLITSPSSYEGLSPIVLLIFLSFFICLFFLSKKRKITIASIIFISFLFISATYTSYAWGVDSGQGLLMYALVIVISAILINTKFAVYTTFAVIVIVTLIGIFHLMGVTSLDDTWKQSLPNLSKIVVFDFTLAVIAIVSWLYNREIEKSLKRARASEQALKQERDLLEIKVEERTRELKQAQFEKIAQLYRFAEMGRLTAGFFHDIATPLSLISLNLTKLNKESQQEELTHLKTLLKRAIAGTQYMESFVEAARKQLQNQEIKKEFSLNTEVKQIINMLHYKMQRKNISIMLQAKKTVKTYGNPIKFNQIITNLLLNAIDAYDTFPKNKNNRIITISIEESEKNISITVQDFGSGIHKEYINKIFDPFFTTKDPNKGTGLGLSITKDTIKKNFSGKIVVKSNQKSGTVFIITFPKILPILKPYYAPKRL